MSETTTNRPPLEASSRIMAEAAAKRGIECQLLGDRQTILMSKNGHQWYTRGSRTSWQSSVGKTIADYKPLTKLVLSHFQLPTAPFVLIKSEADFDQLSQLQFPVVVKPVGGRHGKDVSVGVADAAAVRELWLGQQQPELICEEMLQGTEYRVVCVDYQLVAVAFRKPAHVVGDGEHTIAELIEIKNQHPWRGKGHTYNLTLIEVDDTVRQNLADQKLELEAVVPPGQEVTLRKTANLSTGGEAWDVTDQVCPENKTLFEAIARACDLNVIGIDIMCQDLATPIVNQTRAGVIEVNASPGLRMHHYPIQGQPRDVASAILEMIEQKVKSL